MDAFGVMVSAIQLTELARRSAQWILTMDSIRPFDQQDVSSMKTEIDIIMKHLQQLLHGQSEYKERIIPQCLESCENISGMLRRFQGAHLWERVWFTHYTFERLSLLRRETSVLALTSMRGGWHDLERNLPFSQLEIPNEGPFSTSKGLRQPRGHILLHLLTSNIPALDREQCKRDLKNHIMTEIYSGGDQLSSRVRTSDPTWEKAIQTSFLRRLHYSSIDGHQDDIWDAHGASFNWLFDPSVDNEGNGKGFRDWVSNSQPLLWLKGKAGAGKTTLAKSIISFLKSESGSSTAFFFFRGEDHPIQRSLHRLLQSLVLQLASQNPETLLTLAPSRWEALALFNEDPKPLDAAELQQMLVSVLHQLHEKSRVYIIIDALDEYEGTGSHLEILELLQTITVCPGVKICILSRPVSHLESLIGSAPGFVLEDCIKRDIEDFVTSKIDAQLSITPENSVGLGVKEQLVHELTLRARGCFLWANLVTKSLEKLIADGNGDDSLLRFVNEVPIELTELFRSLLGELDASKPFVASTLRFIVMSDNPVSALRLSFMEMPLPEFVLQQKISSLSREQLYLRTRESTKRIVDNSKGLLEVTWPKCHENLEGAAACGYDVRVKQVHRSLKEFVLAETVSSAPSVLVDSYDLAARYCAASLSMLKVGAISDATSVSTEAIRCAHTAMFTRPENEAHVLRILDELECTCHALLESLGPLEPWMSCEHNDNIYDYSSTHGFPVEKLCFWHMSNVPTSRSGISSPQVQARAMVLCSKYCFARQADLQRMACYCCYCGLCSKCIFARQAGMQSMAYQCPHCLHGGGGGRCHSFDWGQTRTTRIEDAICRATTVHDNMESPRVKVMDSRMNTALYSSNIDEVREDQADDSDNVSWESFSSAGSSLDESHPLMAFKDEITESIFQGFMEYRKKYTGVNC